MTRFALATLALLASGPALADMSALTFDPARLCTWQETNNGMNKDECNKLEDEAKASIPGLEGKADASRKDACAAEAKNYSGDSGFASYTVYGECLKNGPGSL